MQIFAVMEKLVLECVDAADRWWRTVFACPRAAALTEAIHLWRDWFGTVNDGRMSARFFCDSLAGNLC